MTRILKRGFQSLQILKASEAKPNDKLKKFHDKASAQNFLNGLRYDHFNMMRLRSMLRESTSFIDISLLDDYKILEQIACRLVSGQYKIVELKTNMPTWSNIIITETEKEVATHVATTTTEDIAWVKFMIIEDDTGNSIPNVNLKIKLPNGSQKDFSAKEDGSVEINGIEPGNCEVTCDIKGVKLSDTLSFVGMGMLYSGKKNDEENSEDPIKGTLIANIEEHKVISGETLVSLASTTGMSVEELAEFNWGTSDPEEINEHLIFDVGCSKKTDDGKSFILDDSDDPGIIYIPGQWKKESLPTNKTHTVRLKGIRPLLKTEEFIFSF